MSEPPFRLAIVTPVFNDWASLSMLLDRIRGLYGREEFEFFVVVVDDGSTVPDVPFVEGSVADSCIRSVEVVHLATNVGHQRAIAIGLVQVSRWRHIDGVLVMDSDGEDRPEEIASLIAVSSVKRDAVVLAERAKRSEKTTFKIGYFLYRIFFRTLTGRSISSGNFVLIPVAALKPLTFIPTLWNNLAATLIRSRFPLISVPTVRGKRYAGESRMNLISLVIHGLSGISVYVDIIFVRILLFAAGLILFSMTAMVLVVFYKIFTNLATPGWATAVLSTFLIIMIQAGIFMVGITLLLLGNRSSPLVVPAYDADRFVDRRNRASRESLLGEPRSQAEEDQSPVWL